MHLKGDSGFCVKKRDRKKARMDAKRAEKMASSRGEMMVLAIKLIVAKVR